MSQIDPSTTDKPALALSGLKVLVAEDEAIIALDLEATLQRLGCHVLPSAPSVTQSLALLQVAQPDIALLDVSLADGSAVPVAEALCRDGIPFAVMTGHNADRLTEPALRAAPRLFKPYGVADLRRLLLQLAATVTPRTP